jgi:hypothetical protein
MFQLIRGFCLRSSHDLLVELGVVVLSGFIAEEFHGNGDHGDEDTRDDQVALDGLVVKTTKNWLCDNSAHDGF